MTSELTERVMDMIADETRCNRSKLRVEADLLRDLGVDGDDADDLLVRLRDEFGVNPDALQFHRHFGPEAGFNPLALLRPSWWRWQRARTPVRIADLVEAARTRTWPIRYSEGPSA